MTRDEVIKALECHIKGDCVDCPYREGWHTCNLTPEKGPFADTLSLLKQEPKRGKWVEIHGYATPGGDPVWGCSECGKGIHIYGIEHTTYGADVSDGQWLTCPNCGALMEGEDTECET